MRKLHILAIFVLSVLMVSFVSAGFFNDFFGKITGKASTTGDTNVTIGVSGTNPVTIEVFNLTITGTDNDPSEGSNIIIQFFINVSDADGVNDINDSSVNASFSFYNSSFTEATRTNSSCLSIADISTNVANFSCSILMAFFDGNGIWNITVSARDLGDQTIIFNTSQTFQYDQLKGIIISPTGLTFSSVSPGATNEVSDNDPTLINNTGNFNVTLGGISITATNLIGASVAADEIPVANFSVDTDTGGGAECSGGTTPSNASITSVASSSMARGDYLLSDGSGQEQLYYCVVEVPVDISSQTYSSALSDNGYGAWTITMT